jgi:hypothetical protein
MEHIEYTLRPASERDRKFLYDLHCRTMRDLISKTWGWDEAWQVKDFGDRFRVCEVSVIDCHGSMFEQKSCTNALGSK